LQYSLRVLKALLSPLALLIANSMTKESENEEFLSDCVSDVDVLLAVVDS